jgi:lipoprotein-anchoring transpeptidase ErfK/SrfK
MRSTRSISALVVAVSLALSAAAAAPQGAGPAPSVTGNEPLAPGQFVWDAKAAGAGPLLVAVNIDEQMAYVYRNGRRIGRSTVSTGKEGHDTPTGVFSILQKNKDHYSKKYNNAPMPYMQRLTWDGIALHAGKLPGYPASHGCVRLPYEFSKLLFGVTEHGATVVMSRHREAPSMVSGDLLMSNRAPATGAPVRGGTWSWAADDVPGGILTIVLSQKQKLAIVLRDGREAGRAPVVLNGPPMEGTTTYILLEGAKAEPSRIVPGRAALNWLAIGDGVRPDRVEPLAGELVSRISFPSDFAQKVYDNLRPGATVVITNESLETSATGSKLTVMSSGGDEPKPAAK